MGGGKLWSGYKINKIINKKLNKSIYYSTGYECVQLSKMHNLVLASTAWKHKASQGFLVRTKRNRQAALSDFQLSDPLTLSKYHWE